MVPITVSFDRITLMLEAETLMKKRTFRFRLSAIEEGVELAKPVITAPSTVNGVLVPSATPAAAPEEYEGVLLWSQFALIPADEERLKLNPRWTTTWTIQLMETTSASLPRQLIGNVANDAGKAIMARYAESLSIPKDPSPIDEIDIYTILGACCGRYNE